MLKQEAEEMGQETAMLTEPVHLDPELIVAAEQAVVELVLGRELLAIQHPPPTRGPLPGTHPPGGLQGALGLDDGAYLHGAGVTRG